MTAPDFSRVASVELLAADGTVITRSIAHGSGSEVFFNAASEDVAAAASIRTLAADGEVITHAPTPAALAAAEAISRASEV